jgi:hypothetical protein
MATSVGRISEAVNLATLPDGLSDDLDLIRAALDRATLSPNERVQVWLAAKRLGLGAGGAMEMETALSAIQRTKVRRSLDAIGDYSRSY